MVDGSFSSLHSTARAWHIDAVRGRPPHQILFTGASPQIKVGEGLLQAIHAELERRGIRFTFCPDVRDRGEMRKLSQQACLGPIIGQFGAGGLAED